MKRFGSDIVNASNNRYLGFIANHRHWAYLTVTSCLCGWVLAKLNLPAAWMIGPMLVSIVFAIFGKQRDTNISPHIFQLAQATVGIAIASSFQLSNLDTLVQNWVPLVMAGFGTLFISVGVGFSMSYFGKVELVTSILGTLPGGAAGMVSMSESVAADTRLVAVMQYLRLMVVILSATFGARFLSNGRILKDGIQSQMANPVSFWQCILTFLIIVVGMWIGLRIKLPMGAFLCSMILGIGLSSIGLVNIQLPSCVSPIAYAIIGVFVGNLFDKTSIKHAGALVPYFLVTSIILIISCAGLGWLLMKVSGFSFVTCFLGSSPGGIDSISVTALGSGANMSIVVSLQTARMLVIILVGPIVVRMLSRLKRRNTLGVYL